MISKFQLACQTWIGYYTLIQFNNILKYICNRDQTTETAVCRNESLIPTNQSINETFSMNHRGKNETLFLMSSSWIKSCQTLIAEDLLKAGIPDRIFRINKYSPNLPLTQISSFHPNPITLTPTFILTVTSTLILNPALFSAKQITRIPAFNLPLLWKQDISPFP